MMDKASSLNTFIKYSTEFVFKTKIINTSLLNQKIVQSSYIISIWLRDVSYSAWYIDPWFSEAERWFAFLVFNGISIFINMVLSSSSQYERKKEKKKKHFVKLLISLKKYNQCDRKISPQRGRKKKPKYIKFIQLLLSLHPRPCVKME